MKRRPIRRARRDAGFTLIELMVALVLFSFAVAGVLSVAVSMANGFREQRLAVETEASARAAMEYLGDALRGASPGVPSGEITDTLPLIGGACKVNAFEVINSETDPDELIVTFASGSVVTSTGSPLTQDDTSLTVDDYDQLADGDLLLLTDFTRGHIVSIGAPVVGPNLTLDPETCGTTYTYPVGTVAVRVQRARFYIDENWNGEGPMLMMEANGVSEPLAEGVEDMQIAIGRDPTGNGLAIEDRSDDGADEWIHNVAGETDTIDPVRAVRVTLIARGREPMTGPASFVLPAAEDRPAALTPDNFRRRVLTSVIEIRNLGGSP